MAGFTQGGNPPMGNGGNPMMVAPRDKNFKDAQTTYGNGSINTQTQGLNPYVQFAPQRMDQMNALIGMRRPQQQQQAPAPRQQYRPDVQQQRPQMQREADKQVPILGRFGTIMGYGTAQPGSAAFDKNADTFGM